MSLGSKHTRINEDIRFEVDTDGKTCGGDAKKRLAFTNITEADSLVPQLQSRTGDGRRANLRGNVDAARIVNFRVASQVDIK